MSLSVDPTTNRTTTSGLQYDANGNLTNLPNVSGALSYDIENRTGSSNSLYSNLAYDMENQPLDRGGQWNLYGLHGERLGTYTYAFGVALTQIGNVVYNGTLVYPTQTSRNIYFGGRLIQSNGTTVVVDAQGSVRANESGQTFEFYPYGEEMGSGTTNGREKFATYTRETNGLDYANQRYYSSTYGAFTSADPLHQTATTPADPNNPGSWNRFAYTTADPINRIDPLGTSNCAVDSFDDSGDSDDGDVNLGSNCGSGFEPGGNLPSGATRCHTLPGVIFTFNGVPSTCQDGIIVAVDTAHVTQPQCSISEYDRPVSGPFDHTYLEVSDPLLGISDILEGGPTLHPKFPNPFGGNWGSLNGLISGTFGANAANPLKGDNPATNDNIATVVGGAGVCLDVLEAISDVVAYDNGPQARYLPWPRGRARNSNSFTYTLLQSIGLNDANWTPNGNVPGWGLTVPGLGVVPVP